VRRGRGRLRTRRPAHGRGPPDRPTATPAGPPDRLLRCAGRHRRGPPGPALGQPGRGGRRPDRHPGRRDPADTLSDTAARWARDGGDTRPGDGATREPPMTERHSSGVIPLDDASSADLLSRVLEAARVPGALVVFDLDSTLLDNRPRQARILREYGVDHEVPLLADSRAEHWDGWDPRVAMRATGLAEASVESHHAPFRAYWHERFFTS